MYLWVCEVRCKQSKVRTSPPPPPFAGWETRGIRLSYTSTIGSKIYPATLYFKIPDSLDAKYQAATNFVIHRSQENFGEYLFTGKESLIRNGLGEELLFWKGSSLSGHPWSNPPVMGLWYSGVLPKAGHKYSSLCNQLETNKRFEVATSESSFR